MLSAVVVPHELDAVARQEIEDPSVEVIRLPTLRDPKTWYALDLTRKMRPVILQRRQAFGFSIDQDNWEVIAGARGRGAVGAALPFLITRCRCR